MHISSRFKLTNIFSLLFLFVVGLALRGFGSMPTHAAKSTHGWRIVPSPQIAGSTLQAVAAVSATNAWAVGSSGNSALIEHWNGKQWSVVASPNVGAGATLNAVKASSATNIWAVGNTTPSGSALIEHYNGTQWSIVSGPSLAPYGGGVLSGMTVLDSTNIWAAGYYYGFYGSSTLIEHWDGIQWSVVPSPDGDNFSALNAINAASPTDIWAVGDSWTSDGNDAQSVLIEHWDGIQWSVVSSPSPGSSDSLNAVIAIASNDVRAVGSVSFGSYALAEHWNGVQWTYGSPPSGGFTENFLNGEVAFATNNIWAVGGYANSSPSYVVNTLIEHWNGKQWTIIASPNATSYSNDLIGISKVPNATTLWAVGQAYNGYGQALIEYYS